MKINLNIGNRVRASDCSGLDSGKVGIIVPQHAIPTNERGIPNLPGHYKPIPKDWVAVKEDNGNIFTMPKSRLQNVNT